MKNRYIKQLLTLLSAIMLGQVAWGQTLSNPTQTLCFGTVQPYCVDCAENDSLGTPGSTYTWTIISGPGVPIINGQNENDITIDWSTVPAGDYVLQVLETNATCQGDLSTLNITISPLLEATITPAATPICSGAAAVFNITGPANGSVVISVGGTQYTIALNGAGTGTHSEPNATADVTADLVSVSNGTCSNPVTETATVAISPLLVAAIDIPASPICYEGNAVFTFTGTPNTTLSITVNGAAQSVSIGAGGTGTYTANAVTVDQVVVLVSITDGTCTNPVQGTATVLVDPLLEATVVEVLSPICYNGTASFTVTGPVNGSVTLTVNGATQVVAIDANGLGTVTVNNAIANQVVNLVSATDGTCTNTVTGSATVVVNPLLQATVAAVTPICSGNAAIFNFTGPNGGVITYNVNGGAAAELTLDANGVGQISIANATADQTVNLLTVSDGTCTNDVTGSDTVVINDLLVATIAPAATPICSGAAAVFNVTGPANGSVVISVGGTQYTIALDNAGNGTHTESNATADVTADLVSVSNGTCGNPVTGTATVAISPLLVAAIDIPASPICYEGNAVFTFTGTPNTTLSITVNGAAQSVSIGAGGTGTYTASTATVDQVVVLVSITDGTCTNDVTGTQTIVVSPLLEATVVDVLSPICFDGTASFTVTGPANGSVTLTVNGVSQPVSLDGTGVGTVTVNNAQVDQVVNLVSVTDGTCTNTVTGSATVVVEPLLEATVTAITPICSNEAAIFNVTGPANGTVTYNVNGGAVASLTLDASGNGQITVPNATADQTVNLLTVTDGTCTNDVTGSDTVVINDLLVATIAPAATPICSGAAAVFNVTGPANGSVVISVGGTQYTISLDNAGNGTHTESNATADVTADLVSVSNGTCDNPVTGTATVAISPLLQAQVLTPTTPICYEDNADFSFTGTPNTTLNITVNGTPQTVTLDGSGAGSYSVSGATVDQTVVLVSITNGTCTNDVTGTETVAVNPQVTTSGIFHN